MKVIILSVYLHVFVRPSLSLLKSPHPTQPPTHTTTPHPNLPYQQHPPLSLPYTASIPIEIGSKRPRAETTRGRNDSGPKQPRAETTHLLRPKWPTPKIGQNYPGRNDPDSIKILKVKPVYQQMTLSPKLGVVEISTLWHFRLPLLIQMFINVASSPRLSGIRMPSPILWSRLLRCRGLCC